MFSVRLRVYDYLVGQGKEIAHFPSVLFFHQDSFMVKMLNVKFLEISDIRECHACQDACFLAFVFNYYICPICQNLLICLYYHILMFVYRPGCACVCVRARARASFRRLVFSIVKNVNVHQLYHILLSIRYLPEQGVLRLCGQQFIIIIIIIVGLSIAFKQIFWDHLSPNVVNFFKSGDNGVYLLL
jgi:hypothetical protein